MRNLIKLEKWWQDENLLELDLYAQSEQICLKSRYYVSIDSICLLNEHLVSLLDNEINNFCWESGDSSRQDYALIPQTPRLGLKIVRIDKKGHIKIEVDAEINDGEEDTYHKCNFNIYLDTYEVIEFVHNIKQLMIF